MNTSFKSKILSSNFISLLILYALLVPNMLHQWFSYEIKSQHENTLILNSNCGYCVNLAKVELCFPELFSLYDSESELAERELYMRFGE